MNWPHMITLAYESAFAKSNPVLYDTLLKNRLIQVQAFLKDETQGERPCMARAHLRAQRNFFAALFDQFDLFAMPVKVPIAEE